MPRRAGVPAPGAPESHRSLPPHPDIEFEKKRAKKLLRAARAAGARTAKSRETLKLADAQLAVAREYGFSSWPKLVSYYQMWGRHERSSTLGIDNAGFHEKEAEALVARHGRKNPFFGQLIATFLPRLYGRSNEAVFASSLSIDEARFIVARQKCCATWDELCARANDKFVKNKDFWASPCGQACTAIRNSDLAKLIEITAQHPELLTQTDSPRGANNIRWDLLVSEKRDPGPAVRAICDWLVANGQALRGILNRTLIQGYFRSSTEEIAYWLDRGADPDWVAPNGISVLEHAICRYGNGEAVDLIAKRVRAPEAFWISAGLGDLDGTLRYFDRHGKLTAAARKRRPDFTAIGPSNLPGNPDATDQEVIFEAFYVAGINGRLPVLAALLDRGLPVDFAPWGTALLHFAGVTLGSLPVVRFLLDRGADPDLVAMQNGSPRQFAEELVTVDPSRPDRVPIRDLLRTR